MSSGKKLHFSLDFLQHNFPESASQDVRNVMGAASQKKFKLFVDISVTGSTETLDPTFGKKLSVNTKRISRNGTTESKSEANDSVKTFNLH